MAMWQHSAGVGRDKRRAHNMLLCRRGCFVYLAKLDLERRVVATSGLLFGGRAAACRPAGAQKNAMRAATGRGLLLRFATGGSKLIVE
jgi:hypothetical protein